MQPHSQNTIHFNGGSEIAKEGHFLQGPQQVGSLQPHGQCFMQTKNGFLGIIGCGLEHALQGPQHVGSEHPQGQCFLQIGVGLGTGAGLEQELHGPQQDGSEHPQTQCLRH